MNDQDYVDDIKTAFTKGERVAFLKVQRALEEALKESDWETGEGLDLAIRIVKNLK